VEKTHLVVSGYRAMTWGASNQKRDGKKSQPPELSGPHICIGESSRRKQRGAYRGSKKRQKGESDPTKAAEAVDKFR